MPKQCKADNCGNYVFGGNYCKWHQHLRPKKEKPPKVYKPIKKISKKLSKELNTYSVLRKEFLSKPENMFCAVYPHLLAVEVHHMRSRGKYLNDTSTWLAVSREGHMFIEMNPELAKERGFSMSRLHLTDNLNDQDRDAERSIQD